MANFETVAFEALFKTPLRNGLTRPIAVRGTGVKMVNMGEIFSHNRIGDIAMDRVRLDEREASNFLLEPGDLLFARQSLVLEGAGKCSIFLGSKEPVTFESHIIRARINRAVANPMFFFYFFQSPSGRDSIRSIVEQVSAAGIRGSDLAKLAVPRVPMQLQDAISSILTAFDEKIQVNQRMNETLERSTQAIFRSWFGDIYRAMVLPTDWKLTSLGALFHKNTDCVITGPFGSNLHASDYRTEGVPLILCQHIVDGRITLDDLPRVGSHKLEELDRYRVHIGDIVFTRVGMRIGRTARIQPVHEGWMISGQTMRVRLPLTGVLHSRYLAQMYLQPEFVEMIEALALGSTRPSLNTKIIRDLEFVSPPFALQQKFGDIADTFDQRVELNIAQSRTLAALRDGLLPKLISGDIRIPDAEKLVEAHA